VSGVEELLGSMTCVDTSVLLYAISRDPAEQDKARHANDILAERDLALPEQVLQEFYVRRGHTAGSA
jgi:predicted nucleic acid-binding protein